MAVERRLGDACSFDDLVDSDVTNTGRGRKQAVGGIKDPLSGSFCRPVRSPCPKYLLFATPQTIPLDNTSLSPLMVTGKTCLSSPTSWDRAFLDTEARSTVGWWPGHCLRTDEKEMRNVCHNKPQRLNGLVSSGLVCACNGGGHSFRPTGHRPHTIRVEWPLFAQWSEFYARHRR